MTWVIAFNLGERWAATDDGERLPVTDLLDADGNSITDPAAAHGFVCGPTREGQFIACKVAGATRITFH